VSKILKRPMFKRGGTPNTGIMDGFDDGGSTNPILQETFERKTMEKEPVLDLADYASLFKLGAGIASAPGRGSGLGGVLAAAGPSLQTAADEFAASQRAKADRRRAFEQAEDVRQESFESAQRAAKSEEFLLNKKLEGEMELAKLDKLEKQFVIEKAAELRKILLTGTEAEQKAAIDDLDALFPTKAKAKYEQIAEAEKEGWKDYEETAEDILERIEDGTATNDEKTQYAGKSSVEIAKEIAIAKVIARFEYAEGGRVGFSDGGRGDLKFAVERFIRDFPEFENLEGKELYKEMEKRGYLSDRDEMQQGGRATGSGPMLTFEELRARLPMEVTDQVVRLLASSEAALLDFANIDTQEDIAVFNQKYNVDLQLPTQAV
jgi:hypothetical protein